jgi:hypothetical protein
MIDDDDDDDYSSSSKNRRIADLSLSLSPSFYRRASLPQTPLATTTKTKTTTKTTMCLKNFLVHVAPFAIEFDRSKVLKIQLQEFVKRGR